MANHTHQSILAVQQQWLDFELTGNVTGVVSLCLEDVVWLPPDGPPLRGKSAVAAWLAALPKHQIRRIEITNVQIHHSHELAYKLADFATWLEGTDAPVRGSHLWVLREPLPGHWHIAVVAWSTTGPASNG